MILVLSRDASLRTVWQHWLNCPVIREKEALGKSIMVVHPGREPKWPKLAQKLGRYASRVVCPAELELPKERPWKRLDSSKIREQILSNTFCRFSQQLEWVGLYDPEGRHTILAWELAQCFPRVTVWCRFRERYDSLCSDLMEQLGAVLELTSAWEGLMGCPLIGAMEPPEFRLRWDGDFILPGRWDIPPISGSLHQDLALPVPEELLRICPKDIDPRELYLAFLKEERKAVPQELCYLLPRSNQESASIEKFL